MTKSKEAAPVPASRFARLARLGTLATSVAGGMLAEGARKLASGKRPSLQDVLLTPANARRVASQLARLRGAAMKVGQLLSMDAGDFLPKELADILARLRSDAAPMPAKQLMTVLGSNWGPDWQQHFKHFSLTPYAAASIGQVHRAIDIHGQALAIKIQYPGVRQSIDSDVDNVAGLLRMSGLLPASLDIKTVLAEAKAQLHAEADYRTENHWLGTYHGYLMNHPAFKVPQPAPHLTTENILAMEWVDGVPIESLVDEPQAIRDFVAAQLFELLMREVFEFRLIQTDPNFANYQFDPVNQKVILLDFGATRSYPEAMVNAYRQLVRGAITQDRTAVREAAYSIGYFGDTIEDHQRDLVLQLFELGCEPLAYEGDYDFANSDLPQRAHEVGMMLAIDKSFWHAPPMDALLLHRKLGGLFLLASRLKAKVNVHQLLQKHL